MTRKNTKPLPSINKVLNHTFDGWDLGECTIRSYLVNLGWSVWVEGEGFSGKRPFGNSGWKWDVYAALADGDFISYETDEDGYMYKCDEPHGNAIINACFEALANPLFQDGEV
jgi:hypothetical protein